MKKTVLVMLLAFWMPKAAAFDWQDFYDLIGGKPREGTEAVAPAPLVVASSLAPPDVDMGSGVFRVTGFGAAPPNAASAAQSRLLAVGAAELDAMKKLAGILNGTQVASDNESSGYLQTRYTIQEKTEALLKGVRVIETRYNSDRSAEVDVELVLAKAGESQDFSSPLGYRVQYRELRSPGPSAVKDVAALRSAPEEWEPSDDPAAVDVHYDGIRIEAPWETAINLARDRAGTTEVASLPPVEVGEISIEAPADQPKPFEEELASNVAVAQLLDSAVEDMDDEDELFWLDDGRVTDLVLDARGLGFTATDDLHGYVKGGTQIYPFKGGLLEKYEPEKEPKLCYAKTLDEAAALPGFGTRPLLIKVKKVTENNELMLSRFSLVRMRHLLRSRLTRGQGYVVILTD